MSVTYTTHYEFGKQEDYSDLFSMKVITDNWDSLDTILYAFATGKQDKIDSTHKLAPELVSFSTEQQATLDSGVTTEDVEQIETNKTNILSVADQTTQYNIAPIKSTITTGNASVTATVAADKSITIEITGTTSTAIGFEISDNFSVDTSAQYVMSGCPSSGAIRLILQQAESPYNWIDQQYNNQPKTVTPTYSNVRYYIYIYANSSGTITIKPMITPKATYDAGFTDYQPYAMSNVKLTEEVILLAKGIKLVAHTSNNGNTSLSYDTNINDFYIGANTDKNSGVYLIVCNNWSTTPAPYIGLLTFSGATTNHFVKTDIVTGFAPTISITENTANATIDISGAVKISIYAIR